MVNALDPSRKALNLSECRKALNLNQEAKKQCQVTA